MQKHLKTFYWIIGVSLTLGIFVLMTTVGSLHKHSDFYLSFAYPHSWELNDYSEAYIVTKNSTGEVNQPFNDQENLINFEFPSEWLLNETSFANSEICKHIQLSSPDQRNNCLIQVWNISQPFEEFILEIKNAPVRGDKISNFHFKETQIQGKQGYLVTYKHDDYICKEIYLNSQDKLYRVAYFYSGAKWTKEQESNLQTILNSLQINYQESLNPPDLPMD